MSIGSQTIVVSLCEIFLIVTIIGIGHMYETLLCNMWPLEYWDRTMYYPLCSVNNVNNSMRVCILEFIM